MTPDEVRAWDDYIRRFNEGFPAARLPRVRQRPATPDEIRALAERQEVLRSHAEFEKNQEKLRRRFEFLSQPKSFDGLAELDRLATETLPRGGRKPFLTAADLVMLREMRIGL